jgi:hypothetical protein
VSDDILTEKREEFSSEIARGFRRQGYWTLALFLILVCVVFFAGYVRSNDVEAQVRVTSKIAAEQSSTIEYLCETVSVMDLIIVQESRFLENASEGAQLGPNQREQLRERLATLDAAHFELTDQRACRGFQ